ncbi:hypothetical protein WUBG_09858, partial [Wuchereria bancrofti]
NIDTGSRKSSTSSQKSARRRGKVMEETVIEFEDCLEHVELVKSQFKEHEMFMQSLTESQDGVGRVLHRSITCLENYLFSILRGQQLVQRMEEEDAGAIVSQLLMVNAKWERIREVAMSRQNQLQHCLNAAQIEQLESISALFIYCILFFPEETILKRNGWIVWKKKSKNAPPLTMNRSEIEQLINAHTAIQERIENEQKAS